MTDRPGPAALALAFLGVGARGFGGLGAVLALLSRDLVGRRGWVTDEDVTEALTYTKLLPGSTVVQVVAYLGFKLGGLRGALAATAAFVLPSFLLMLALAAAYRSVGAAPGLESALAGLTAAVVGLLAVVAWTLGRKSVAGAAGLAAAAAAFVASVLLGVSPALIVVAAGLGGVLLEARRGRA